MGSSLQHVMTTARPQYTPNQMNPLILSPAEADLIAEACVIHNPCSCQSSALLQQPGSTHVLIAACLPPVPVFNQNKTPNLLPLPSTLCPADAGLCQQGPKQPPQGCLTPSAEQQLKQACVSRVQSSRQRGAPPR